MFAVLSTQAPAYADSCDHSLRTHMSKTSVVSRSRRGSNPDFSIYNRTRGPAAFSIKYGYTYTKSDTHSWEVGGSAVIDWKIVRADLNGKYGRSSTEGFSVTRDIAISVTVPVHYTGWWKVLAYKRYYYWYQTTERWNDSRKACVTRTVRKAQWSDWSKQFIPITRKGHVFPRLDGVSPGRRAGSAETRVR